MYYFLENINFKVFFVDYEGPGFRVGKKKEPTFSLFVLLLSNLICKCSKTGPECLVGITEK
jgi:hypothetical protein